ncbi:MAG: hypothetical protein ACRDVD_02780 [Acidimicrobiia bacterium]
MTASILSRSAATININHLRHGATYRAITHCGSMAVGEYLGIEVIYDDWRILLRHRGGTESIAVAELASVTPSTPGAQAR